MATLKGLLDQLKARLKGDFREEEHPRAEGGRFGDKPAGEQDDEGGKREEPSGKEGPKQLVSVAEAQARLAKLPPMPGGGKFMALAPFKTIDEFPFDGAAMNEALDKFDVSEEMVPLAELVTEQVGVERRGVEQYLDNPALTSESEEADPRYNDGLIVVRTEGVLYLVDGNHRGTAAVLRGMEHLKAYVVDLPASAKFALPRLLKQLRARLHSLPPRRYP